MYIRNEKLFESLNLGDGTGAVINKNNNNVFFMNTTAWLIWEWCSCAKSINAILDLFKEYTDAEESQEFKEEEIRKFIERMHEEGLIIYD